MTSRILIGDCREWLGQLDANSMDACVCDPPYHLTSIVKRFGAENAAPAKVGKTGAYERASRGFMGQTWDGGDVAFDPETWAAVYRVLKPGAHLIAFSGTRTYHRMACAIEDAGFEIRDQLAWCYGSGFPKSHNQSGEWEGWGTALKPAWEPICLARKPLQGTVAGNLAMHGTGALNIDGCRIASCESTSRPQGKDIRGGKWSGDGGRSDLITGGSDLGRWPANIIHDGSDEVLAAFPESAGQQGDVKGTEPSKPTNGIYGDFNGRTAAAARNDSGSAARFFYCAKATTEERGEGNNHPTVKPIDLMRYLCRLITPPGGTVLDPFMGSGSTLIAADAEQFNAIGCELSPEYAAIAESRIRNSAGLFAQIQVECLAGAAA
jgi:site-specific DNA-methyltransferase (adenine-specific)